MPAGAIGAGVRDIGSGDVNVTGAMTVGGAMTVTGNLSMGSGAQILADVGTVSAPGYSFVGRTGVGGYSDSVSSWKAVVGGGVYSARFASGGIAVNGSASATSLSFSRRTDLSATAGFAIVYDRDNGSGGDALVSRLGATNHEAILDTE